MNVAKLLEKRHVQWSELERLCDAMEVRGRTEKTGFKHHQGAEGIARFSTLYRAACADLALADAYQLPPGTVTYLHRLVARSHNQLYRADKFEPQRWCTVLFETAPQQIFSDPCVRVATIVFFGLFALSMFLGLNDNVFPGFADRMVGAEALSQLEESFSLPLEGSLDHYVSMSGFYIWHNTGIGLRCFAYGILLIPCLVTLAFNAIALGTMFGYMARPDTVGGDNFFEFVTAHGPFELTAIALAAAAGLRIGIGLFYTGGLARTESIRVNALKAVPVMASSALLFTLAAITEGFISPSPLPYMVKAIWSVLSSGLISFYFVVLGFPREVLASSPTELAGDQPDGT